jgi:hypothetical protein
MPGTGSTIAHPGGPRFTVLNSYYSAKLEALDGALVHNHRFGGNLPNGQYRIGVTPGQRDDRAARGKTHSEKGPVRALTRAGRLAMLAPCRRNPSMP